MVLAYWLAFKGRMYFSWIKEHVPHLAEDAARLNRPTILLKFVTIRITQFMLDNVKMTVRDLHVSLGGNKVERMTLRLDTDVTVREVKNLLYLINGMDHIINSRQQTQAIIQLKYLGRDPATVKYMDAIQRFMHMRNQLAQGDVTEDED
jgi:hypothetical protein